MIIKPMDIPELFPVRKSAYQKKAFRESAAGYLQGMGYAVREEKGKFGCRNLIAGDPEKAPILITAHYDTCAGLPFPNLITPMNPLFYLIYQLFLTVLVFLVSAIPAFLVWTITSNVWVLAAIWYGMVWCILILMMVGPSNRSNANDNTSGVVTLLETAASVPGQYRDRVCFVLFDLEEAGLIGSAAYMKKHGKAAGRQLVLNLDCVGDGNEIWMLPSRNVKRDIRKMKLLRSCMGQFGDRSVHVAEKGIHIYPSDQSHFPYGVGICALRRNPMIGRYMGRIHTRRDRILNSENVIVLRDRLVRMIYGYVN